MVDIFEIILKNVTNLNFRISNFARRRLSARRAAPLYTDVCWSWGESGFYALLLVLMISEGKTTIF
jgi:hypothetical protein